MNIIILTSEYPFPPRNGVTIPVANYIKILEEGGAHVDLVVIGESPSIKGSDFSGDVSFFTGRKAKLRGAVGEIFGKTLYSNSFYIEDVLWREKCVSKNYDYIICSPISMVKLAISLKEYIRNNINKDVRLVSAISDCLTAEFYYGSRDDRGSGRALLRRWQRAILKFRYFLTRKIEPELLMRTDLVLVQSDKDKAWLRLIGGSRLSEKVEVFTNGVEQTLFSNEICFGKASVNFCYVADLNVQHYFDNFIWLCDNVWSELTSSDIKLYVYSKVITDSSKQEVFKNRLSDSRIISIDYFVKDIADIYKDKDVALAPIFKSYGFINKVGEAMAAGLVVVGDSTAFNGINCLQSQVHAIVANDAETMILGLNDIIGSTEKTDFIRANARALALEQFQWKKKSSNFRQILDGLHFM